MFLRPATLLARHLQPLQASCSYLPLTSPPFTTQPKKNFSTTSTAHVKRKQELFKDPSMPRQMKEGKGNRQRLTQDQMLDRLAESTAGRATPEGLYGGLGKFGLTSIGGDEVRGREERLIFQRRVPLVGGSKKHPSLVGKGGFGGEKRIFERGRRAEPAQYGRDNWNRNGGGVGAGLGGNGSRSGREWRGDDSRARGENTFGIGGDRITERGRDRGPQSRRAGDVKGFGLRSSPSPGENASRSEDRGRLSTFRTGFDNQREDGQRDDEAGQKKVSSPLGRVRENIYEHRYQGSGRPREEDWKRNDERNIRGRDDTRRTDMAPRGDVNGDGWRTPRTESGFDRSEATESPAFPPFPRRLPPAAIYRNTERSGVRTIPRQTYQRSNEDNASRDLDGKRFSPAANRPAVSNDPTPSEVPLADPLPATSKNSLEPEHKTSWQPTKKLTFSAMAGLRALHQSDPGKYNRDFLSERFGISYEAVRRILKSKFREGDAGDADELGGVGAGAGAKGTKWDLSPESGGSISPVPAIRRAFEHARSGGGEDGVSRDTTFRRTQTNA